jgi:hypothetical protein
MSTTTTELVSYEDLSLITERVAVAGTLSIRRLDPPIRPKFHPRPRAHNDGNSSLFDIS